MPGLIATTKLLGRGGLDLPPAPPVVSLLLAPAPSVINNLNGSTHQILFYFWQNHLMFYYEESLIDYFLQLVWFHFAPFYFQICHALSLSLSLSLSLHVIELDTKYHLLIQNLSRKLAGLLGLT